MRSASRSGFDPRLLAIALAAAATLCGTGCATGSFYASNLPAKYHAPPFRARSTADLSRFATATGSPNVIAQGDVLEVAIASGLETERPAPWMLRVDPAGGLDLPLIGPVRVEGLEISQAETLIREESIRRGIYRNPHVAVGMKERRTIRVTVVGEVTKPGTYEIPAAQASLVTAIAAAGGMGEKADTRIALRNPSFSADVRLASADVQAAVAIEPVEAEDAKTAGKDEPTRVAKADDEAAADDEKAKPADEALADAKSEDEDPADDGKSDEPKLKEQNPSGDIQLASAESDAPAQTADYQGGMSGEVVIDLLSAETQATTLPVHDGAVVVVKEKPERTIQVIGLVNRPDRFDYPDDQELRLLDAIALAGGRTMEIADSVKIIRQTSGDEKPVVILASIRYAKQGETDNLTLMAGDVVSVEETPLTFTVDAVRSLLRFGVTTF